MSAPTVDQRTNDRDRCAFCDAPLGDDYTPFSSHEGDPYAEWDEVAACWLVSLCAHCAVDYDGEA